MFNHPIDKRVVVAFDDAIPTDVLKDLHFEICAGIARSGQYRFISRGPYTKLESDKNFKLTTFTHLNDPRMEPERFSAEQVEILKSMTTSQLKAFFEAHDSFYFNDWMIPIRSHAGKYRFENGFYSAHTTNDHNAQYFSKLLEWIYTLPFEDIGRIMIMYTPSYGQPMWHYDAWPEDDNFYNGTRHFMWINPTGKKFHVRDIDDTVVEVDSKICMFDFSRPHASQESTESSYTIRVEGQFKKEFAEAHGLVWSARA